MVDENERGGAGEPRGGEPRNGEPGGSEAPREGAPGSEAAGSSPAATRDRPGRRAPRTDSVTPTVRICLGIATVCIAVFLVWDYIRSRKRIEEPSGVVPQPALPVPRRDVEPGGWLYGLRRVTVDAEKPWVKIGVEIDRRRMTPPVSKRAAGLKDAYLSVALFTDGTYVQLREVRPGETRAIVCAPRRERYGVLRALFERCSAGGSPVTHVLVRCGDEPAAVPVTLGALPLVAGARRVNVEVTPAAGTGRAAAYRITAKGYGCAGFEDLSAKLNRLRSGGAQVLVRLAVADELSASVFVEAVNACLGADDGGPPDPVYVALTPLK